MKLLLTHKAFSLSWSATVREKLNAASAKSFVNGWNGFIAPAFFSCSNRMRIDETYKISLLRFLVTDWYWPSLVWGLPNRNFFAVNIFFTIFDNSSIPSQNEADYLVSFFQITRIDHCQSSLCSPKCANKRNKNFIPSVGKNKFCIKYVVISK